MDLTKLNTKAGAEKGADLHLRHPAMGHLVYTGKGVDEYGDWDGTGPATPVCVTLRGTESRSVQDRIKALQKQKLKNVDDEESGLDFVCSLVIGFKGLTLDGKPMEATPDNIRAFFMQSDSLVEQVLDFVKDKTHFFSKGSPA